MRLQKRITTFLLSFIIMINLVPAVSAAHEDSVLTSIGHAATDTVLLSGTAREATLTVPHGYSASEVDLVNGLAITYDLSLYKSVVAVPASKATVGGDAVTVRVTFNNIGDGEDVPKSVTEYFVRVVRAGAAPASFSGVIGKTVEYPAPGAVTFAASDFTALYSQNDGKALGHITISGSNLVAGTLMYAGAGYVFDTPVDAADLGRLSFSASAYGEVSYNVKAYEAVTSALVGTAVLTVTVYSVPTIESAIGKSVYKGASISFTASDFTAHCILSGMPLLSVEITPTNTGYGAWYLGSNQITSATEINTANIGSLSFKGDTVGTAAFDWRVSNAAGFSDYGTGSITVSSPSVTLRSYTASSSLVKGNVWTISTSDFGYSPSSLPLTYIKINTIPASADGYLYLTNALSQNNTSGYPAIRANTALTSGAVIPYDYIKYLRLSTKTTSTSEALSFTWTATADSLVSSATWASAASYTIRYVTGGTVYYDTYVNVPVTFSASDFSSRFQSASGYDLSYVTFTLPDKTKGSLYYDYSPSSRKGTAVSSSTKYYPGANPNLSHMTFVPAEDYTGSLSILYKAYNSNGDSLSGTLYITVSNSAGGTVVYTTDKNSALQLDAADFSRSFSNATGETLSYVKFTLPSSYHGKLYYDYVSYSNYDSTVSSSQKYYVYSSPFLSYVSFVPYDDYTGTVTISFMGYDEDGDSYSGKLVISVVDSPAGIVYYTSRVNGVTRLSGEDFADEFISVTGSVLSYVQFTLPQKTSGMLYYNYSADTAAGTNVSASTKYYNGAAPDISDISFVPVADFAGEVVIQYTVYTARGVSNSGKLKIRVGEASSGAVYYETDLNTPFQLKASDFIGKFYANTGGSSLSYVTFTLPSSSYGKLYYNYTSSASYGSAVMSGARYYAGLSPYLSDITFVPQTGYSGSFTITYMGYAADGTGYPGKINVTVDSNKGMVSYRISSLNPVTFRGSDFSTAFYAETGKTLSYVKFTLPSSPEGTLYYGYSSSGSYNSAVSYTTKYYVNSSPSISYVTFVPNPNFSGVLTIHYTAYDTDGDAYGGAVTITVSNTDGGAVSYETIINTPVTLDPDDFIHAFEDGTGYSLNSVRFTLPPDTSGVLYYGYTSSGGYTSKVASNQNYYMTYSPMLSNVTFVPYKDYSGTVSIRYTAYTSSGVSFTGELIIRVRNPFTDVGPDYSWASAAVSYLYQKDIVRGTGEVRFSPGNNMSRGDFMLMVYRAFSLDAPISDNFSDVGYGSYYYNAIAAAKALGIAKGEEGRFRPDADISRQDAMVIVLRTLQILGKAPEAGSSGELVRYSDAGDIADYAVEAVATLTKAGVITGSGGALHPKDMMSRAEMAVLLYRILMMNEA